MWGFFVASRKAARIGRVQLAAVATVSLSLAACGQLSAPSWWNDRYGLSATIDPTDINNATSNLSKIIGALYVRAGLVTGDMTNPQPQTLNATSDSRWYNVMEAGFGYVDEKCNAYFTDLDILYRQKNRIITGITQIDKVTNAILSAVEASAKSLTVVGQAFGLAEALAGTISDSYLYSIDPSHVAAMVLKQRIAYRQSAETAKANINA